MTEIDLPQLIDRAAISDTVNAYATGLDRRDWALYRSIFTDEIEMDFTSLGMRSGPFSAEDWVRDAQRLFAGWSATQHTSSNHVHQIRGDTATCTSYMQAEHFVARGHEDGLDADLGEGDDRWTIGGYYLNELVRTADGWKLAKVTLVVTWQTGNRDITRIALKRGRAVSA
jgi:hypothetical protein